MKTIKELIEDAMLPEEKKEPTLFEDLEQSLKEAKAISTGQAPASRRLVVIDEAHTELTPDKKSLMEHAKAVIVTSTPDFI